MASATSTAPSKQLKKGARRGSTIEVLEERRVSLPLARLNLDEERFFELVESGSVNAVQSFLNEHKTLNLNCTNYKGMSALHIALKKENEPMVKMLLGRPDIEVKDAALQAVATGNVEFATAVLDVMNLVQPGREMLGSTESTDYSPDITPLALAAQNGDYKMVRMLLGRGHKLDKPHVPTCLCPKCKGLLREHGSALSRIRLNAYRAISNPSYICQVTDDPILYCFLLDAELFESALMDKEFRAEYGELGDEVRGFTVEVLNQCRNTAEVELLLKLPNGFDFQSQKTDYPRLQLALDYKQKEFVAHSMVQQVLTGHWLGEFRSWPRRSLLRKILHVFFRILLLPFISLFLLLVPWLKQLGKYHSPVNRFLLSLASYLLFLTSVFMVNILDTGHFNKGPPGTGFEGIVVIFVLGHIWSTIRQFWVEGYKRFFRAPWNWYDICMQIFFTCTFIFWLVAAFDKWQEDVNKKTEPDRKAWNSYDATLVHEGLFAIASVLASGKLAYYCLQSSRLGPLQDNADVEFKFHRTKLWMHFFDDSTLVPSPFNLIPSPGFFKNVGIYCTALANKSPDVQAKFSWQALMSSLVQRYFRAKEGDE
ncbi:Transient receptor potential-gamma protein like [Argiope bruennichi]|uniref:Transient receptor potential-gamma protein like n=1 Tax=Argiope bruennichi TaxID=94029 RepID=A0A8T0G3C7_ARGBR|nr:Transient receptor potential-gamma protein like [Argiope bruennichi]